MTRYRNGEAPLHEMVKLGDKHYLPHGTAARWREMQRLAWEKYGVWLEITPGWNGYRPLHIQYEYRAELGVWAAVPGYSSHGLTFNGQDMAAIDVNNWRSLAPGNSSLAWARFVALCRIVGFITNFVSPEELWHIGDPNPFSIPAFADISINPRPVSEEEQIMGVKDEIVTEIGKKLDALNERDVALVWVGKDCFVVDDGAHTKWNAARGQSTVEEAFLYIQWMKDRGAVEHLNQAPYTLAGYDDITSEGTVRSEVQRGLLEYAKAEAAKKKD